jgi:hypothetical protein
MTSMALGSVSRLLVGRGRRDEAKDFLAPFLAWFQEGFGTPTFIEDKARYQESACDCGSSNDHFSAQFTVGIPDRQ